MQPASPPAFRYPPAIVIDCHFLIFALTLTSAQRQAKQRPPEYQLIEAFEEGRFAWVKNLWPVYKGIQVIADLPAFLALVGYRPTGRKSDTGVGPPS